MKFTRKGFVFIVLILSALVLGGYIGQHTSVNMLSYTVSCGLDHESPLTLNLIIATISIGLTLNISIAQILCIFGAIIIFDLFSKHID